MSKRSKIIYTSEGPHIEDFGGSFRITRLMWNELRAAKGLVWRLFIRDFTAKYRQSLLGVLWALLTPLITVGMFVGMNRSGLLTIQDTGIPYPIYAIIGLTIWNLFTVGLVACSSSLVNAGAMVIKINFPKAALVLAASGQGIVELLIRLFLIMFAFLYYGRLPSFPGLFIGFICLIPVYLIMTGLGFILSLATGVLRDIPNILNLALTAFMLLTPILYPINGNNLLADANVWNPFNYLINVPRDFIVKGHTSFLVEFLCASIFSVVVFYLGWKLFYLAQTKIAERL